MNNRLLALDIFRGMTIFFMIIVNTPGSWSHVYGPLTHAKWDGLTPTDLVFPFFVFIVGVAMSFSFLKYDGDHKAAWIRKVFKRTILIFLVGLALNWFPFYNKSLTELRIFGVLQRIALAYGFGSLVVIFLQKKWLPAVFTFILAVYHIILLTYGGDSPLSLEDNAVRKLDLWLLDESHLYGGYGIPFDPEGLLSTLPTVGTVLFGYWIGKVLQSSTSIDSKIGALWPYAFVAVGFGIAVHFLGCPINKPLWSSSYVLLTGGLATASLMILLWMLDKNGWKSWTYIFHAFGKNPLISFVLSGIIIRLFGMIKIADQGLYGWLYSSIFQHIVSNPFGSFLQALCYTMFIWLFALWMYRRGPASWGAKNLWVSD